MDKLAAFKKAKEAEQARVIESLTEKVLEVRRVQEAEWEARQAAEKKAAEARLKALEDLKKAEEETLRKKLEIRRREARAEHLKALQALKEAQAESQKRQLEEEKRRKERMTAAEKEAAEAEKQKVLTHPQFLTQPKEVQDLIGGMKPADALEALSNVMILYSIQRSALRRKRRSAPDLKDPVKQAEAAPIDT